MIASTPINDVVELYGDIVFSGDSNHAFILACERALAASAADRARRLTKMRAVLSRTSWTVTARAMEYLIERAVAEHNGLAIPTPVSSTRALLSEQDMPLAS
jgi:hypothetical protein